MSDFIHVAGWTQHNRPTSQRSLSHLRSLSSTSTKTISRPTRPVSKSISTSALHTMAAVTNAPGIPTGAFNSFSDEDGNMSTLPDPRSRAMSPANDPSIATPSQQSDLDNEVTTLSNKLISAINHQTTLDDTLSATRHELELSRERVKQLESENKEYSDLVSRGILVKRATMELEKAKVVTQLMEEKRQRADIEKEKKNIEQELENLTTALFEEANKMVITAREEAQREHDIIQRRNDLLKAQLADTESLLRSQQEQLAELKQVMEHMTEERDDQTNQTAPSTPGFSKFDSKENSEDADVIQSSIPEPVSPTYPTSFTHLLQMVLRTDLSSYDEFASLVRMSKNVPIASRTSSGSYTGLGIGLGGYSSSMAAHTNGSSTSLSTASNVGSAPPTPTTPASTISSASSNGPNSLTPLKETKFYKRALAEDIEPTLRLDTAPGLSWLARRTVLNAICDGTLVVEPMPTSTKPHTFACSLCGETRKDAEHTRTHRFRTNESDNAQRYPLCKYCLGRLRSTCDFLGFLRVLKEGHWRCDDEESERAAWEESVRLREQMFWCRMGGGVVPVHPAHSEFARSPRASEDERKEMERKISEELERTGEIQPKDVTPPSKRTSKVSIRESTAEASESITQDVFTTASPAPSPLKEVQTIEHNEEVTLEEHQIALAPRDISRDSTQSTASLQLKSLNDSGKEEPKRLSITIPGAFE